MTKKIAAAVFALLTLTAPAHAAIIQWDLSDVMNTPFSNSGAVVTGFFDYNTTTQTFPNYSFSVSSGALITGGLGNFTLTSSNSYVASGGVDNLQIQNDGYSDANAEILSLTGAFDGSSGPLLVLSGGVVHFINIGETLNVGNDRYISLQEGGSATLQGELIEAPVSPVPLPDALPLFSGALLVLAGLAWWRRGKVS